MNIEGSIKSMEITKTEELGLCFGVKRAVKLLEEAASKYGGIETLGPATHNQQLVERLVKIGVRPAKHLDQVQGKMLAIATHGTSPQVLCEIQARGIRIIDTTCPIVRKVQKTAKELAGAGFDVIIFGEADHSEVRGLLDWAAGRGIAALDVDQIHMFSRKPYRLGVVSQTTQLQSAWTEFTRRILAAFGPHSKEIRIINTLCGIVQRRQEAAITLAKRSQIMLVVGGYNSANTRRLAESCSQIVETHLVETTNDLDSDWFAGKKRVGIAAGTSTPDEIVEEVVAKIQSYDCPSQADR